MLILPLALACRDKELAPLADALEAFDEGKIALDGGAPADAALQFATARRLDPNNSALTLWEARARAAAGDLPAAEALASEVIGRSPELGLAWYNRAAWRARQGHLDAAAEDLRRALSLGTASRLQAAADPDFSAALGTPAFIDLLPPTPVVVQVRGPAGAVFVGSDVEVSVEVATAPDLSISLRRTGATPDCLGLRALVEDQAPGRGGIARTITLRMRALRPCEVGVGPFEVSLTTPAPVAVTAGPVRIAVEAPSTFAGEEYGFIPESLPVPGELRADADGWATGRLGDQVYALGRADVRPTLDGSSPSYTLELRVDKGTRATGGVWLHEGATVLTLGDQTRSVP